MSLVLMLSCTILSGRLLYRSSLFIHCTIVIVLRLFQLFGDAVRFRSLPTSHNIQSTGHCRVLRSSKMRDEHTV